MQLHMDTDNIDTAKTVLLLHGPLPEATWLNHIPKISIVAWIRLGGMAWQRRWRPFNKIIIDGIFALAKKS